VGNSYFIAQNLSLTSMSGGSSVSLFEFDLSEAITASAAQNDMTVPVAGVFSLYHAFNNTNPANTATWLLAKNNVASSLGVTFPNAAGGGTTNTWRTDAVNTLSVTAGDLIRQQCSLATTMRAFGCVFTPTGAHANPMGNGITSISGASTSGALSPTPNLSLTGILNTYAGTWRYLEARSRINTLNVAVNFFLAKNGSASGVTVTVGAGVTGSVRDTTNTVSVADGDILTDTYTKSAGTGTMSGVSLYSWILPTTGTMGNIGWVTGLTRAASATVHYYPIAGTRTANTTELNAQWKIPLNTVFSRLFFEVTTNASTGIVTFRLRKNGADANNVISLGVGVTGWVSDTSNSDSCVAGDLVNISIVGGTSGNMGARAHGIQYDATPPTETIVELPEQDVAVDDTTPVPVISAGKRVDSPLDDCAVDDTTPVPVVTAGKSVRSPQYDVAVQSFAADIRTGKRIDAPLHDTAVQLFALVCEATEGVTLINAPFLDVAVQDLAAVVSAGKSVRGPLHDTAVQSFAAQVDEGKRIDAPRQDTAVELFAADVNRQVRTVSQDVAVQTIAAVINTGKRIEVPLHEVAVEDYPLVFQSGKSVSVPVQDVAVQTFAALITTGGSVHAPLEEIAVETYAAQIDEGKRIDAPLQDVAVETIAAVIRTGKRIEAQLQQVAVEDNAAVVTTGGSFYVGAPQDVAVQMFAADLRVGKSITSPQYDVAVENIPARIDEGKRIDVPLLDVAVQNITASVEVGKAIVSPQYDVATENIVPLLLIGKSVRTPLLDCAVQNIASIVGGGKRIDSPFIDCAWQAMDPEVMARKRRIRMQMVCS
jgi:hypothetical protein